MADNFFEQSLRYVVLVIQCLPFFVGKKQHMETRHDQNWIVLHKVVIIINLDLGLSCVGKYLIVCLFLKSPYKQSLV